MCWALFEWIAYSASWVCAMTRACRDRIHSVRHTAVGPCGQWHDQQHITRTSHRASGSRSREVSSKTENRTPGVIGVCQLLFTWPCRFPARIALIVRWVEPSNGQWSNLHCVLDLCALVISTTPDHVSTAKRVLASSTWTLRPTCSHLQIIARSTDTEMTHCSVCAALVLPAQDRLCPRGLRNIATPSDRAYLVVRLLCCV